MRRWALGLRQLPALTWCRQNWAADDWTCRASVSLSPSIVSSCEWIYTMLSVLTILGTIQVRLLGCKSSPAATAADSRHGSCSSGSVQAAAPRRRVITRPRNTTCHRCWSLCASGASSQCRARGPGASISAQPQPPVASALPLHAERHGCRHRYFQSSWRSVGDSPGVADGVLHWSRAPGRRPGAAGPLGAPSGGSGGPIRVGVLSAPGARPEARLRPVGGGDGRNGRHRQSLLRAAGAQGWVVGCILGV